MKIHNKFSLIIQRILSKGPVREGGRNPYVDWTMIIIVSFIVAILLVINSASLFQRVKSGNIQSKEPTATITVNPFDVATLDNIIAKFVAKADMNEQIKKSYHSVADPSI